MNSLPNTPELAAIAKRVVWYKRPEEALADPVLFLCSLMTHTLPEDVMTIAKYVTSQQLRDALDHAPAGLFDPRSWAYWNIKLCRETVPPMPERRIPT